LLDVPVLETKTGTLAPVADAPIITLAGAPGEVEAQRMAIAERGDTVIAVRRDAPYRVILPSLEELHRKGAHDFEMLVSVANERRMLLIERSRAIAGGDLPSVAVITAGKIITFGGAPIAFEELAPRLSRESPGRIVVLPEPDITMQRLAEVIAASGGHVLLDSASLPRVTPAP
jgi:hypothetical protein